MSKNIVKGIVKVVIAFVALGAGVELGKRGLTDIKEQNNITLLCFTDNHRNGFVCFTYILIKTLS